MTELCETRYPQFSGNADCFQVLLECDFLSQDNNSEMYMHTSEVH